MNRKFWLNCMQQVLNYPEDLCVQSTGDLLDVAGRPALATNSMCNLLLSWVLCLKIYFSGLKTWAICISRDVLSNGFQSHREKSIPASSSLPIGRVGERHLVKQVPQHRNPWSMLCLVHERRVWVASHLALGKPSQWPKGTWKLHFNKSSVHWLRTVTAAKWR